MMTLLTWFGGPATLVLAILAGFAAFCLIMSLAFSEKALRAHLRLGDSETLGSEEARYYRLALVAGFLLRGVVRQLRLVTPARAERLRVRLLQAAIREPDIERYYAAKLLLLMVTPFALLGVTLLLAVVQPSLRSYWWLAMLAGVPCGYYLLDAWVASVAGQRVKKIVADFPLMLDLVSMSVQAGMEFTAALRRCQQTSRPSVLRNEIEQFLHEIGVGASRQEALRNLQARVNHPDVLTFSITLIQAIRLGASISTTLLALADKMRAERFNRAERAGAAAAQKMLVPLMLCILPAVVVIIMGVAYFAMRQNTAMLISP